MSTARPVQLHQLARERAEAEDIRSVGDDDLVRAVLGKDVALTAPISALATASSHEIATQLGITTATASRLVTAFELGRRSAWTPPRRGARCLDPATVYELMRDVAHEEVEAFCVVLLDVRGRLLGRRLISRGSLTQCPVSPRDVLRAAVREGAHGVVFVHNHPSGVMRTTALCGPPSGIARQRAIRAVRGRHNRDATAAEVRS